MKKIICFLIVLSLLITPNVFCVPDNTLSVLPVASSGTTISSSDENSRNNVISTIYNAHSHSDLSLIALSNLASVAINTSLISDTNNTDDLGSSAKKWKDGYFAGNVSVAGTVTSPSDVYTVDWTDYSATSTITGWSGTINPKQIYYKKIGKIVFVSFWLEGTSNSTAASFTLPYTSANASASFGGAQIYCQDSSLGITTGSRFVLANNSNTVYCYKDMTTTAFTASGTKIVSGSFWYQTE